MHTEPMQTGSFSAGGRQSPAATWLQQREKIKKERKKGKKEYPKSPQPLPRESRREFLPLCTLTFPPPPSAGGGCGGAGRGARPRHPAVRSAEWRRANPALRPAARGRSATAG